MAVQSRCAPEHSEQWYSADQVTAVTVGTNEIFQSTFQLYPLHEGMRWSRRRSSMKIGVGAVIFLFCAGCNHEKVAPVTPQPGPKVAASSGSKTPPRDISSNQKVSLSLIHISEPTRQAENSYA